MDESDIGALRVEARNALLDPDARELRKECMERLRDGLLWAGDTLRLQGVMIRSRAQATGHELIALGYIAATSAQLSAGLLTLLEADNPYGAAALLRQYVELEYLGWAFAEDHEEAANWLRSSHKDRLKRWQPRHLRERAGGRFRGKDYGNHCEMGGHPTPAGLRFLLNDEDGARAAGLLVDGLLHGRSLWHYLMAAVDKQAERMQIESNILLPYSGRTGAHNAVEAWWNHDPFKPYFILDGLV